MQSLNRQKGVVIVVALFIVALVATMAYFMMSRLERDIRRTSLLMRNTQAEYYAQGSIAWAMGQLKNNLEKQKENQITDATPIRSPLNEVNGYQIVSTIYDMQARFNLNNLVGNLEAQAGFKKLLQTLVPKLSEDEAREVVDAIIDWVSPDASKQPSKYDKYYLERPEPYHSAHRPMLSISELHLVKGITPELYNAISPYITALPKGTAINIQSSPAPVLLTLDPNITMESAQALSKFCAKTAITTKTLPIIAKKYNINLKEMDGRVDLRSKYFLVETEVGREEQHLILYTLLERLEKNEGKATVSLLWQSKGCW